MRGDGYTTTLLQFTTKPDELRAIAHINVVREANDVTEQARYA